MFSGTITGTPFWQPPEYLCPVVPGRQVTAYNSIDTYGLGVILWQITHGNAVPYGADVAENLGVINRAILTGKCPLFANDIWRPLIESCWSEKPTARPLLPTIVLQLEENS